MAPVVDGFSADDDELDLDCPTEGFSSIPEAIEDIRQGKYVIVVDDEDRENEGDLITAAPKVTPEAMAFIVRHGTGIVCVSMKEEDLERLQLPLMVTTKENEDKLRTAFTVSVDAKEGTTTGVSAKDRANTILALASPNSKPEDFNWPGHIFPLKYKVVCSKGVDILKHRWTLQCWLSYLLLQFFVKLLMMMMAPWLCYQNCKNLQRRRT
uniref:3,4-dihydroxy-2-butanone-4-phosphate synthase n=1 Tax=Arundo donax TaxID=35708 RepID=A0A0A9DAM7_ARUDO